MDTVPTNEPITETEDDVVEQNEGYTEDADEDALIDNNRIITPEDTDTDYSEDDDRIDRIEKDVKNLVTQLEELRKQVTNIKKEHSENKDESIKYLEKHFKNNRDNINYTGLFSTGKKQQTASEKLANRERVRKFLRSTKTGHTTLSDEELNEADRLRKASVPRGQRRFMGGQDKKLYLKKTKKTKKAKNLKPSKKAEVHKNVAVQTPKHLM